MHYGVSNPNITTLISFYFSEDLPDGVEFEVVGDIEKLKEDQKKEKEDGDKAANGTTNGADKNGHSKEKTDTGKFFLLT